MTINNINNGFIKIAARLGVLALTTTLMACSNSSDPSPMQNDSENSAQITDPDSILTSLQFDSPADQAAHQCLLSAATNTASSASMQALPAWWDDNPVGGRGSFQTWCSTSGSGTLVDEDLKKCSKAAVGSLKAPGSHAISVFTTHRSAKGPANTISHSSKKIPAPGEAGWSVFFLKTFSASTPSQSSMRIKFQRFDGNQLVDDIGHLQHPYLYRDNAIGLVEFVNSERSINEFLANYRGSVSQFKSTVDSYLAEVMQSLESTIANKKDLSAEDVALALERARTEIDQAKTFFNTNADELHALLLTTETYQECEGS